MIVSAAWIVPAVFAVINRIAQARLRGWEPATTRELLFEFGDWLLYALSALQHRCDIRPPPQTPETRKAVAAHRAARPVRHPLLTLST